MAKLLGTLLFIVAAVVGYYWYTHGGRVDLQPSLSEKKENISISGKATFMVEVADTEIARERGLSGRASLDADTGVLFVFDIPDTHGFWMKEMHFPLDIIWFDQNGKIIYIENDLPPDTYPHIFKPPSPDLYVLEINAGLADKYGIGIGDEIEIIGKK